HHMQAGDARYLLDFIDDVDRELLAFLLLVGSAFETRDDSVRDVDARHVRPDPPCGPGRGERTDAAQDEALLVIAEIAHALHLGAEHRHVETVLALHELGAGGDLLSEPERSELLGWGER